MDLSQANNARRISVPPVVQYFWNQYQFEDSVSKTRVIGQQQVTTPAEGRFLAPLAGKIRCINVPQLILANL